MSQLLAGLYRDLLFVSLIADKSDSKRIGARLDTLYGIDTFDIRRGAPGNFYQKDICGGHDFARFGVSNLTGNTPALRKCHWHKQGYHK